MTQRIPTEATMKLTDAKQQLSQVVNRVASGEARIVVEKSGLPVVAIISVDEYRRFKAQEQANQARRAELFEKNWLGSATSLRTYRMRSWSGSWRRRGKTFVPSAERRISRDQGSPRHNHDRVRHGAVSDRDNAATCRTPCLGQQRLRTADL